MFKMEKGIDASYLPKIPKIQRPVIPTTIKIPAVVTMNPNK